MMDSTFSSSLPRCVGALLLIVLLAGCSSASRFIPSTGSRPNSTLVPTQVTATLENTSTNTPVPTVYDPLNATQFADATLSATVPVTEEPVPQDAQEPAGSTETAAPTVGPSPTVEPSPVPTKTPVPAEPTPTREQIPIGRLTGGQLGLIPSAQGLWAMRPDGSQMTLLTRDPILHLRISPGGTKAAYLTNRIPDIRPSAQPTGYELKIIRMADNQIFTVLSLDPPGLSENSPAQDIDNALETIQGYERGGLAWSPSGRQLAFVSSHESSAGDIYLYTPATGGLRRLTDLNLPEGPAHAFRLEWSPDGLRLFYAAAYSFGSGAGTRLAGAWITTINNGAVQVAAQDSSIDENVVEWLPGPSVLLSSASPDCGDMNLRVIGLNSGRVTQLWSGCYRDMFYNEDMREVLISVTADVANPDGSNLPGLYRVPLYNARAQQILDRGFERLYKGYYQYSWLGFNPGEGLVGIASTGQVSSIFTGPPYDNTDGRPARPLLRLPDSTTWLWSSASPNGLFLAQPGSAPRVILADPPQRFGRSPGEFGLYFFIAQENGVDRLYAMRSDDWQPFLVDERIINPESINWTVR